MSSSFSGFIDEEEESGVSVVHGDSVISISHSLNIPAVETPEANAPFIILLVSREHTFSISNTAFSLLAPIVYATVISEQYVWFGLVV